jgi:2-polyprenyl-6-methoxyphenol hydroxylase-like FAD-dependent oxidoreductase
MKGHSILIAGAGPTGLTAAVELARHGIVPRIIDRDNEPSQLSKAVGISPRSLDILEPSGATARLLSEGIKIQRNQVWYEGRPLGAIDLSLIPHRFNFLLSLPQSRTESILVDVLALHGGTVEWGTELVGLCQAGESLEASLNGPAGPVRCSFDHVFGADGVHSAVREAIGIPFDGYTHKRLWSIADAEIAEWPYSPDAAQLFFHRTGDIGFIIPMAPGRFRAVSNTSDALACIPGQYCVSRLLRADTFHISARQADRYQAGKVCLGGDAAHVHSPVGARGMNLGIEDAAAFAARLLKDDLAGYTAERQPVERRWIALSERILSAAQVQAPAAIALRNLAVRATAHWPSLQRRLLQRFAGLRE